MVAGEGKSGKVQSGKAANSQMRNAVQALSHGSGYILGMMTRERAATFAGAWFAAWNAHDVEGIMRLYAEGIEHSSQFIARYTPAGDSPPKSIVGKAGVKAYFARALARNPDLKFVPMHIATGLETVTLVYRRMNGDLAAECFWFDGAGMVVRSISHYE